MNAKKPKDLLLASDQRALICMDEIILDFGYRKLNQKSAQKLSKWLMEASFYLKRRKEERSQLRCSD